MRAILSRMILGIFELAQVAYQETQVEEEDRFFPKKASITVLIP